MAAGDADALKALNALRQDAHRARAENRRGRQRRRGSCGGRPVAGVAQRGRVRSIARLGFGLACHARAEQGDRSAARDQGARNQAGAQRSTLHDARSQRRDRCRQARGSSAIRAERSGDQREDCARDGVLFRPLAVGDCGEARNPARDREDSDAKRDDQTAQGARGRWGEMMEHEEIKALLPLAAVDGLEADEARALEEHLGGCAECAAELLEYREAAASLAMSLDPAGTEERIWSRLESRLHPPPSSTRIATSDREAKRASRPAGFWRPAAIVMAAS